MAVPSPVRPSRQAERSAVTRKALLAAAEQIFARDGFEAARIEDIALAAGRSRGAFYANFESKTELFLALREQVVRKRAREIRERVRDLTDPVDRDRAIKAYMVHDVLNQRQLLLEIEFKLFAVRRPEMLKDLANKHLEAGCRINEEELAGDRGDPRRPCAEPSLPPQRARRAGDPGAAPGADRPHRDLAMRRPGWARLLLERYRPSTFVSCGYQVICPATPTSVFDPGR
jgi:AcrR family transcriptional regulator